MMKTIRYYALIALAAIVAGCSVDIIEPPEPVPAERVFLMYDNIGEWFIGDIEEAGAAVAAGVLDGDERVVVFQRDYYDDTSRERRSVIYELVKDSSLSAGFRRRMLKVYGAEENAALSKEVIEAVVTDIRTAVPAAHYGLVFGSHGKGWVPKSGTLASAARSGAGAGIDAHPFAGLWAERENLLTRFFSGYEQRLDVAEFVDALDGFAWDFIILDDCFMASVEALYDMRTLADYIIASPTEIYMNGFPFTRVLKTVFGDWSEAGFKRVAADFIDHYKNLAKFPYGTIAVVKMAEMDGLAATVRALSLKMNEVTEVSGIQYYDGMSRPGHIFFDLDDYVGRIRKATDVAGYNAFAAQLARTVIFSDHTERFYSDYGLRQSHAIGHYSGLNVFIPWSGLTAAFPEYRLTAWYKAVYAEE